nr:MAG TPA: hypothetical protein [Caudoviricetes sp.]
MERYKWEKTPVDLSTRRAYNVYMIQTPPREPKGSVPWRGRFHLGV